MSVLIRGMEIPYGCANCDFCGGIILPDGIYCCDCPAEASHGKNISDAINNDTRAEFCPLIEIPPHSELIDKEKLMQEFMDSDLDHLQREDWNEVVQIVSGSPTVIEGSET